MDTIKGSGQIKEKRENSRLKIWLLCISLTMKSTNTFTKRLGDHGWQGLIWLFKIQPKHWDTTLTPNWHQNEFSRFLESGSTWLTTSLRKYTDVDKNTKVFVCEKLHMIITIINFKSEIHIHVWCDQLWWRKLLMWYWFDFRSVMVFAFLITAKGFLRPLRAY